MLTIVKKNDSYDAITYQLENEDNSTVDLTGASVNFVMGKKNKLITNAKATVTSATSGIVSYQLTPLDTLVSGTFLAEFVVTFANGTTKTYPSNGYITVDVEQNLDTSQNNVVLDMIATKQGDFEAKLDSILKQGIGTQVSAMNEYTWTATSGQTIFVFPTNAKYDPSAKWFQVSVGNVPIANELINRASSSQFSLVVDPSLIVAGMTVHAMWVEPIVPITGGHHATHEINGQDEINIVNLRNYQELVATPIASNTTALADKAKQHWFNVLDYGAVKSKVTDCTSAITKCINAMSDGDVLYFPDGDYAFTNITITKDIAIIGDNANLYCLSTSGIAFLNYSPVTRVSYTPTSNILASDKTLTVPVGIDLSSVLVGDIVFIKSNKSYNSSPSFKQGSILKITAISSNTLTLNGSIQYDLSTTDGVTVYIYKAFKNANVTGININLISNSNLIGLYINCGVNVAVSKCVLDGGGYNSAGVWLRMCFDSHVEKIHAKGFKDLSLSIGYGVVVSGKYITVSKCSIRDCKSSISAGDNDFTNYNITLSENYAEAIIGAHGSCQNVEIRNNFLRFVAGTQLGVYIIINGKNFNVHHNTIVGEVVGVIDNTSAAIKCLDLSEHITIESNNIFDMQYGIKADETANIVRNNFKFKNNKMINVAYGIYMKNFSNAEIVDNRIISTIHGIWLTPTQSDFLNIANNYIEYGSSGSGNGARLENVVGGTVDKLIVTNNKLKINSGVASDGVRIFLGYTSLLGTNNKFNNVAKTSAILLTSDTSTDMVKRVQNNNDGDNVVVYTTVAPTTGTWLKGDRVVNSSPAVGSPKAWVCTVAGTPGTWVSEGNL